MSRTSKHQLSLDEQLARFNQQSELAFERLLQLMVEERETIIAVARARLIEGYALYGDTMWHWDEAQLLGETLEELADAVNYQVVGVANGRCGVGRSLLSDAGAIPAVCPWGDSRPGMV